MAATVDPSAAPNTILPEKSAVKAITEETVPASSSASSGHHAAAPTEHAPRDDHAPPVVADPTSGPRTTPFPHPLPDCTPPAAAPLTPEQRAKYDSVRATARAWTHVPTGSGKNASTSPITAAERMWLTRECLLRYLRATKWAPAEASRRLLATLAWRREYGVGGFTPEYIGEENATGKQINAGFDREGRPCLYLIPSRQNTKVSDRQVHHLVFMLERAVDLMPPGQETLALVIDYSDTASSKNPPLSQSRTVLGVLQGHYPERLGRALIANLPWYINTFYKLINPFIDPVTKTKMKFNEPLPNHVPQAQLLDTHGGEVKFEYDHDTYWPALNALCEERRAAYRRRWEERGSKVGDSEWILKGGEITEELEKELAEEEPSTGEKKEVGKKDNEKRGEEKQEERKPSKIDEDAITPA